MYNFGTKMVSFVQFLANFGTKTYKNCTKNGIFLLYLWIKRINVALINNKWYAYLHKLPPHWYVYGVYNVVYTMLNIRFCIQYSAYYMVFQTISLCVWMDFIMCEIRDFALFLVKICRIIQKYPPFCRKDFF